MSVNDILKKKGPEVFTIGENKSIAQALELLVDNKIGALLVLNEDAKIVGVLSERDIVRQARENPDDCLNHSVGNVMTRNIIGVEPEDDVEYVESIMTSNRIRHLPVIKNQVLVGIIPIGDVVKSLLKSKEVENKYLKDYLSGRF